MKQKRKSIYKAEREEGREKDKKRGRERQKERQRKKERKAEKERKNCIAAESRLIFCRELMTESEKEKDLLCLTGTLIKISSLSLSLSFICSPPISFISFFLYLSVIFIFTCTLDFFFSSYSLYCVLYLVLPLSIKQVHVQCT